MDTAVQQEQKDRTQMQMRNNGNVTKRLNKENSKISPPQTGIEKTNH